MHLRTLMILLVLVAVAAAGEPAPGRIVVKADEIKDDVFIHEETLDGVKFSFSKPDNPPTEFKRARYLRIEYVNDLNGVGTDWLRGENLFEKGDLAKAAESYLKAANARYQWVREQSALRASECYIATGAIDTALTLLATFEKANPRSVHLAKAMYLRGQAELKKGDKAAAVKTFAALAGKGAELGQAAASLGIRGQGEALLADAKPADAAAVLKTGLGKVDIGTYPEDYVAICLLLGQAQKAAGNIPGAVEGYRKVAYGPVDDAARAKAHLAWAQLTADATELEALKTSFDQALIAASLKGSDDATAAAATALARQILAKLNSHAGLSDVDKAEYRRYRF